MYKLKNEFIQGMILPTKDNKEPQKTTQQNNTTKEVNKCRDICFI